MSKGLGKRPRDEKRVLFFMFYFNYLCVFFLTPNHPGV